MKVVLANAPVRPVTLNGGMRMPSWYDIKVFNNIDNRDFQGLDDSKAIINGIIDEEIAGGIGSKKIIIAGFSQGAATGLYTGLQYPKPLGGLISMSGHLPMRADLKTFMHPTNQPTEILMAHGEADQVVKFQMGQISFKAIQDVRPEHLTFKSYKVRPTQRHKYSRTPRPSMLACVLTSLFLSSLFLPLSGFGSSLLG